MLWISSLFKTENLFIENDDDYLYSNGTKIANSKEIFSLENQYIIYFTYLSLCKDNPIVALIGKEFSEKIKNKIESIKWISFLNFEFRTYDSIKQLNDYIASDNYNTDNKENKGVCFGITYLNRGRSKYTFKIHFFASPYSENYPSIPSTTIDNIDPFRTQPDFKSFGKYIHQGFLIVQKMLYEYVLQEETNNKNAKIEIGIYALKYDKYLNNFFYNFLSMLFGFFILIAYSLPLSINIYRLVKEKESKAKEGMKIMGLNELL